MTRPLTPAERQRLRTPANLWRALIPLVCIVGVAVLFVLPHGVKSDGVHPVDISAPLADARGLGLPVRSPTGLAADWRPTSTYFPAAAPSAGASLRIGWVTPTGQYAELLQSADAPDAAAAQYGPLSADTAVRVGAVSWDGFRRPDGRQLIRHTFATLTIIVTGSADQAELAELAGAVSGGR